MVHKKKSDWKRIAGGYEVNERIGKMRATMKYGSFGELHDRSAMRKR